MCVRSSPMSYRSEHEMKGFHDKYVLLPACYFAEPPEYQTRKSWFNLHQR